MGHYVHLSALTTSELSGPEHAYKVWLSWLQLCCQMDAHRQKGKVALSFYPSFGRLLATSCAKMGVFSGTALKNAPTTKSMQKLWDHGTCVILCVISINFPRTHNYAPVQISSCSAGKATCSNCKLNSSENTMY